LQGDGAGVVELTFFLSFGVGFCFLLLSFLLLISLRGLASPFLLALLEFLVRVRLITFDSLSQPRSTPFSSIPSTSIFLNQICLTARSPDLKFPRTRSFNLASLV
jgi:hypothetical protein